MKYAAFEAAAGEFGKEPLNRVKPGRRGRDEVERPPRMARQPGPDFGVLVAAVIVEDHVDQPAGRDVALEAVEKAQKLLVPMALHALADDRPVEQVEGRKQGCRAVADIIVGHRPGAPALHRQARLSTVERLDLALLIDREHQAVRRRVDVKSDHVMHLGSELRVTAELKGTQPVRGEAMRAPDLLHRANRQAHGAGHRPARPVGGLARRHAEGARDQAGDNRVPHRRFAGFACLVVQQPVDPGLHETALPAPHAGLRYADPTHYFGGAAALGRGQDDLNSPHMLLRAVAIGHDRLQPFAIPRPEPDFDIFSHPRTITRNPNPRESSVSFIPLARAISALDHGSDYYFCDSERGGVTKFAENDFNPFLYKHGQSLGDSIYAMDCKPFFDRSLQAPPFHTSTSVFRHAVARSMLFDISLRVAG